MGSKQGEGWGWRVRNTGLELLLHRALGHRASAQAFTLGPGDQNSLLSVRLRRSIAPAQLTPNHTHHSSYWLLRTSQRPIYVS